MSDWGHCCRRLFTRINYKEWENYNLLYLGETSLSLTYKIKIIINKNKISTVFYSTMILRDFKINNESYHIAFNISLFIYKIFVLIILMTCCSHIHTVSGYQNHSYYLHQSQSMLLTLFFKTKQFYYSKRRITDFVSNFLLEKLKVILASQISAFSFPISFCLP